MISSLSPRLFRHLMYFVAAISLFATSSFAARYRVVHNFQDTPAAYPSSQLVYGPDGNLYGTTGIEGGACPGGFCGNVYQLTPTGSLHVIHTFTGDRGDGQNSFSPVVFDKAGNLYGTTVSSLSSAVCDPQQDVHIDCGTIFELSPNSNGSWTETVLYRFTGQGDGAFPTGPLAIDASGNLFGTTNSGGSGACPLDPTFGCGTAYELSPNSGGWTLTTLHSFTGSDGYEPSGLMIDASGNLIGTTAYGGTTNSNCLFGCGFVYSLISTSGVWSLQTLYSFTGSSDGAFPGETLTMDASGNLYGAAGGGGIVACNELGLTGCGTIFELSPVGNSWNFTTLHSFDRTDGQSPIAVLPDAAGNLYGVSYGGIQNCPALGCGIIFNMVLQSGQWQYTILYKFTGENDGGGPHPLILDSSGDLVGTTESGGTKNYGVIFEFIP